MNKRDGLGDLMWCWGIHHLRKLPNHRFDLASNPDDQVDGANDTRRQMPGRERHQHHLFEIRRVALRAGVPGRRQDVMRFIDDNPMRPARPRAELEQIQQHFLKERRPIVQLQSNDIRHHALLRLFQSMDDFGNARRPVCVAQHERAR